MKSIAILTQLSKCWDFLWDFRFNDVIPRSCDQIFFKVMIFSVKHVPYHNKYIFMYWLYIQKIIVSWIMPDEAKKLNFFNTKVDHMMHKLPADYVINLGYTNQNRLMDLQRPSFVPSFIWIIKNLLREFWGDTYIHLYWWTLCGYIWILWNWCQSQPGKI